MKSKTVVKIEKFNLTMRYAAIQIRQIFRDLGMTISAARYCVKILLCMSIPAKPGSRVDGIRRHPTHDNSMAVPFGFVSVETPPPPFRVAVACHMFHPDLSSEFREYLSQIPGKLDLIFSTDTDEKRIEIVQAFTGWRKGEVDVRIVANRGRDIAPKLIAYGDMYENYDLVLYIHSKRNSHFVDGTGWRHYLLHNLAGSPAISASIIDAFGRDSRLGIVMPQHWDALQRRLDWGDNFFIARALARRMGISLSPGHVVDFPSGSMFWARPAALRPLLDLGWRVEDFPSEMGQLDGTPAHAVERLFLYVCEAAGYRWVKVCDPSTTKYPQAVIPIETPAAFEEFCRYRSFRLTALGPS